MKRIILLLGIFLIASILFACAPKVVPAEKATLPESPVQKLQAAPKEDWQMEWEKTLREAVKEGKIIIYTGTTPETRAALSRAFEPKFNIGIEWVAGRGTDIANKILTERRAGIYNADLIISGTTTFVSVLKPKDILDTIVPQFILPEVTDVKYWYENKYQFADKDKLILYLCLSPSASLYGNSNLVKKEELKAYSDVLNPKWKEKISMNDPTIAGGGLHAFSVALEAMGEGFLRELAKQKPFISRDERLLVNWLAQGKHAISFGGLAVVRDFQRAGAPLFQADVEVDALTQGFGALVLLKNTTHPQASRVFINWILTREAQEIFSKFNDKQSIRVDIGTDWLDLREIRKPGVKYLRAGDEDFVLKKDEHVKLAEEIFGPLMK